MKPWNEPRGLATGILDDITYDWIGVVQSLLTSSGSSVVATEEQIKIASEMVPSLGIETEPTGAASVAGVISAFEAGQLTRENKTAVLLTGKNRDAS